MEDHLLDPEGAGEDLSPFDRPLSGGTAPRTLEDQPQRGAPFLFLLGGNPDEKEDSKAAVAAERARERLSGSSSSSSTQGATEEGDATPLINKLRDPNLSDEAKLDTEIKILVALYEQSAKLEEGFKVNSFTLGFADDNLEMKYKRFFGILNEHKVRIRLIVLNFLIMLYSTVEWFSTDLTHPGYLVITRSVYLTLNIVMFIISFVYREWYRDIIQVFSTTLIMSTACLILLEGYLLSIIYSPLVVLLLVCYMVVSVAYIRVRFLIWTISSVAVFLAYDIFALTLVTKGDSVMKPKDIPQYLIIYNIMFVFIIFAFMHLSKKAELSSRFSFAVAYRVYRDPSFRDSIAGKYDAPEGSLVDIMARSLAAHEEEKLKKEEEHAHAHGPPIAGAAHNSHGPSAIVEMMDKKHFSNLFSYLNSLKQQDERQSSRLEPKIVNLGDPDWPSWMHRYEYINSGYRINYTVEEAFKSMFKIHNETVNVWTEFGPMIGFAIMWVVLAYTEDGFKHASYKDKMLVHSAIFMAFILRPLCSGLAHLLHPINERWFVISWGVDYASIVITILLGSFVYGRWTFYCLEQQQMFFFISVTGLCLMTLVAVLFVSNVMVRVGSFFLYTVFANGVPFFYSIYLKYANSTNSHFDVPDAYLWYWLGMLLFVGFGMVVKSLYIPERFFKPGTLDIIGQSHQIWHIMINVGNGLSVGAWALYMRWRQHSPCPPSNFSLF